MFRNIIYTLVMLPMAALLNLFPNHAVAQNISLNRVYDFSGNTDTLNSEIKFVYADSNRIIALGEAYPTGANPHAFTAAFDYSGNLLWEKAINLPNGLVSLADGFDNLKKVKPNLYVALGNIPNVPKMNGILSYEPFLYFFNAQGDSLHLVRFPSDSTMLQRMTALTVDSDGEVVAGGVTSQVGEDTNSIYPRNYWFVKVNDSGILKKSSIFPLINEAYFGRKDPEITKILPVSWDSISYVVAANTYVALWGGIVIEIDSQFDLKNYQHYEHGIPAQSNLPSQPILVPNSNHFEFNFLKRKGYDHSFYWSLPAVIRDVTNLAMGIYYAKALSKPGIPEGYQLQWDRAIIYDTTNLPSYTGFPGNVQGRSSLAEAINGDMLLQKEASRPSDTTLNPFLSQSGYFLPVMLRVDSNGTTRWGKTFQYSHNVDSGLYHSFNDVSVAPDGRIVMGGYLRSRYPVPGYDTVGTVSWLVVLDDSLHDHDTSTGIKIPSLGSKAEMMVYPNPTLDNAFVVLQHFEGNLQDVQLQLCAINGRVLQSRECRSTKELIHLEQYPSGIYFIKVLYHGKLSGTVKVVKD